MINYLQPGGQAQANSPTNRRIDLSSMWDNSGTLPNITQDQSSVQSQPAITEHDLDNRKTVAAANEWERQQRLREQAQGTLSPSNFKGDGLTPEERNRIMYNPQGLGEVFKSAAMRTGIEFQNGNSVFNGIQKIAQVAMAAGAGGAALGAAGKIGQVANGAMKAKKVVDAAQGMAQSYQNGDAWGVASNALSLAAKAPVGKGVAQAAGVAGGTMKAMRRSGGRILFGIKYI